MRFFLAFVCVILMGAGFSAHACIGDSKEAQEKRQRENYVRYDANHDGQISFEEYVSLSSSPASRWAIESFYMNQKWGKPPEGEEGVRRVFKTMDTDNSSSLTFQEWGLWNPPDHFATDTLSKC